MRGMRSIDVVYISQHLIYIEQLDTNSNQWTRWRHHRIVVRTDVWEMKNFIRKRTLRIVISRREPKLGRGVIRAAWGFSVGIFCQMHTFF